MPIMPMNVCTFPPNFWSSLCLHMLGSKNTNSLFFPFCQFSSTQLPHPHPHPISTSRIASFIRVLCVTPNSLLAHRGKCQWRQIIEAEFLMTSMLSHSAELISPPHFNNFTDDSSNDELNGEVGQSPSPDECFHYIVQSPDPTNSPLAIAFFCALYTHIFVLGLLGNLAIVFLTLRCQHLRSVQNIFILNLAISDVIVCLLSLPFTLVTNIYKEWLFGNAICHLLPMVQAVSVLVSTFSLSAIAIDRYWLVHYPHARSLSPGQATILAAVLWALSLLISIPYAYYMIVEKYEGYCGEFCSEQWPNTQVRRGYALSVLALQFLLPFVTMSFCYASIFSRLRRRNNFKLRRLTERQKMLAKHSNSAQNIEGNGLVGNSPSVEGLCRVPSRTESDKMRANELSKQQRRTTTILASVVLFFGLAWLPHSVLTMLIEYDIQLLQWGGTNYLYLFSLISHSVAMTTNVANPILYAWLNPTFKEMFLRTANPLLLRRKMRGQVNQSNNQSSSNQSKSRPSSAQTSSLGEGRLIVQMNNGGGSPRKDFF